MSLTALPVHVALVDDTGAQDPQYMAEVAGALNEQVLRDFAPVWHVRASVGAYPQAPAGTWSIRLQYRLDDPGALGYHSDENNQPEAFVMATDDWPATASHELLEMLADPWGNRLHSGRLPHGVEGAYASFGLKHPTSLVKYLLEVCDPPEARSYDIGGVPVSDFITPSWYHAAMKTHTVYSYAGMCRRPREIPPGGYVSFATPDGNWWQILNRGGLLQTSNLGRFDRSSWSSLREFVDAHAREARA